MQICLIVAGPLGAISGGLTFDRRMADGLRALGHEVQVIELAGRVPDADQAAIYAARTAWAALPADRLKLIDGLALPAFAGLPLHRVTALIHHPASLEAGTSADVAERLRTIEAEMFQQVPCLVVTSDQTADWVARETGLARDRIAVVAPGIDDLPRGAGSGGPTCQILSVGALIARKGHEVLLRALARLSDLDWEMTIAGASDREPAHAQRLAALVAELAIGSRVHFIEAATDAHWTRADVFALTSCFEGYGAAVAEALRRGIPVAVTSVGAVPTLVGLEAGVVCAVGDIEQMSKALRRLIFDRSLRQEMANVAWQVGQALPTWHEQAGQLAAVLAAQEARLAEQEASGGHTA